MSGAGHRASLHAMGTYVVAWAVFESVVETAIWKRVGTSAEIASILTSDMQTQLRVHCLRTLLKLEDETHPARATLKTIANLGFRNRLQHSLIEINEDALALLARRVAKGAEAERIPIAQAQLEKEISKLTALTIQLQGELGISEADINAFANGIRRSSKSSAIPTSSS